MFSCGCILIRRRVVIVSKLNTCNSQDLQLIAAFASCMLLRRISKTLHPGHHPCLHKCCFRIFCGCGLIKKIWLHPLYQTMYRKSLVSYSMTEDVSIIAFAKIFPSGLSGVSCLLTPTLYDCIYS